MLKFTPLFVVAAMLFCGCLLPVPLGVMSHKNIVYGEAAGKPLRLDLYLPKKPEGKLPVVVWIHGGSWNSGSKKSCPIAFMAKQNLAIVSMDYTLSEDAPFPEQLYDCKGVVRWLRANAEKFNLDPDHIGIFGASAGGHLALLLAATDGNKILEGNVGGNLEFSSRVQCVCAFYPPTDLNHLVTDEKTRHNPDGAVAKLVGGPVGDNVEKADAASPITYLNSKCAPVFLMHGSADKLVPVEQGVEFYQAAIKAGVESHLEIIAGKGHGIIAPPDVAQEIYHFYNEHLGRTNETKKLGK